MYFMEWQLVCEAIGGVDSALEYNMSSRWVVVSRSIRELTVKNLVRVHLVLTAWWMQVSKPSKRLTYFLMLGKFVGNVLEKVWKETARIAGKFRQGVRDSHNILVK